MFLVFIIVFVCSACANEDGDLGYTLKIGHAINLFANYGDLGQVTQVISADYELENTDDETPTVPFSEKNIRIFANTSSVETTGGAIDDNMVMLFCDTFDDLMDTYFRDFHIQGLSKPWKAFMGDWIQEEIMRTLGIEYDPTPDNCCYVLAKLTKTHSSGKMSNVTTEAAIKGYVRNAIKELDVDDDAQMRMFMQNYGTHYIDSYATGNFIYQVFKYKKTGYNLLKSYMKRSRVKKQPDNLRFYFSSYFLRHVGDIRIASGNKTIEAWARQNLRDTHYYSRPSLLKLYYNKVLVDKLNDLLDNGALLGLELKTLEPIFQDPNMKKRFAEIVENDMLLWETNA